MWEKGIELCKELASLYDNEMFDYEKLSWTLVSKIDIKTVSIIFPVQYHRYFKTSIAQIYNITCDSHQTSFFFIFVKAK